MPEYIYIRQVNQSSVHIGRTTDLEERYKLQADQTIEDFKEYLHIFECEAGKGSEVEKDVKTKFKEYIANKNNKNEQYLWNDILQEKYTHYLRTHKYIIRQLDIDEVNKCNKNDKEVKVIMKKENKIISRNTKIKGQSRVDIMNASQKIAKAIQKNNDVSKYTEHDEFYTRYEDIKKMVDEVKEQFKGKVVFCNCDDPLGRPVKDNEDVADCDEKNCSAFALYFKKNFKKLGLKKLICLHFGGLTDIFNVGETIGLIYTFDGKPPVKIKREAGFDGSFYDKKSIDILNNEADIVCTNHPWSMTNLFYQILLKSRKKFLVVSGADRVLTTFFVKYIKNHSVKSVKYCKKFLKGKLRVPAWANGAWMTNLEYKRKPYKRLLPMKEIPKDKIKIDDNGILNFNDCYIPSDYNKEFAVSLGPITNGILELGYEIVGNKEYYPYFNTKKQFARLLIKKSSK